MKAFKTFAQAPENVKNQFVEIPLEWPWQVQDCDESDKDNLESEGFQVLSDESYNSYVAFRQAAFDVWQENYRKIPLTVTPRQIRLALVSSGISLSAIENAINNLPEPQRSQAMIAWEYSIEFQRYNPLIVSLSPLMGFTVQQLNDLFVLASKL